MFREVPLEHKSQLGVLIGALYIKAHKAIEATYPHLQPHEMEEWVWLFIQCLLLREKG